MTNLDIKTLLQAVTKHRASDLHLVSGVEAKIRVDGELTSLKTGVLSADTIENICFDLIDQEQQDKLKREKELDFCFELPKSCRYRANYYYTNGHNLAAAFRPIDVKIPTLKELHAPPIIQKLIQKQRGLILVTGPTGSGKSTTLASMIDAINESAHKHILTIEDPIEFVHTNKKSLISQRGVEEETLSFQNALKYALRQDPDVILIGEMRDPQTIATALSAAETGHLVLATLHTNQAAQTIHRIIDSFEAYGQNQIRSQLASSLLAVISQTLLPKKEGGRVAAFEVLSNTDAIANLIRENKIHQIYSSMQLGQGGAEMMTQTKALETLIKNGIVSQETARAYSTEIEEFDQKMGGHSL